MSTATMWLGKLYYYLFKRSISNDIEHLYASYIAPVMLKRNTPSLYFRSIGRVMIEKFDGFQGHGVAAENGNIGLGLIHYALITNTKPDRILCIGSKKGFIPSVCALACQENGKGIIDFVDPGYGAKSDRAWGGVGFWKKANKSHFSYMNIQSFVRLYVMTTKEFTSKFRRNYQYIYIDGDHSYAGVKKDFRLTWPLLDTNGYMLFHDIVPRRIPGQPPYGVWKFWKELKKLSNTPAFEVRNDCGLGIIQKLK